MISGSGAAGPFWCCVHAGYGDSCRVAGGRTRRRGGPRGLGWNRGDVRPRAQSPVAVAREDSRLGVEESQRFWLTSPTLGRVSGTVVQIAGGGMPKTRENRPLQPQPGGVKTAVMQRTDSLAAGSRWPIIPKWEDRQTCLITCSATDCQKETRKPRKDMPCQS